MGNVKERHLPICACTCNLYILIFKGTTLLKNDVWGFVVPQNIMNIYTTRDS